MPLTGPPALSLLPATMDPHQLYRALISRRRSDRALLVIGLVVILPLAASIALAGGAGFERREIQRPIERALLEGRAVCTERRESAEATAESDKHQAERELHDFPLAEVLPSGAPRVILPSWNRRHIADPTPTSSSPTCILLPIGRAPPASVSHGL